MVFYAKEFRMNLKKIIIASLLASTYPLYAGSMSSLAVGEGWVPVITLSAGPAWSSPGKSQDFYNTSGALIQSNRFVDISDSNTLGTGEIFFSLQHRLSQFLMGRLGIAIAGASDVRTRGTVTLNGQENVASYAYKINHGRVAIKGLLAADSHEFFVQPYISGSLGIGFNHSHSFYTSPQITLAATGIPSALFDYASNTEQGFAFTLGAGILKRLNQNWEVGIGYEFADWGKSTLSSNLPTPWNYSPPHLNKVYTHELQFSLSYLC